MIRELIAVSSACHMKRVNAFYRKYTGFFGCESKWYICILKGLINLCRVPSEVANIRYNLLQGVYSRSTIESLALCEESF